MKTIKVSEASNVQLDYLVAVCEGATDFASDGITLGFKLGGGWKVLAKGWAQSMSYTPTTDWAQMGPIIEREGILTRPIRRPGHTLDGKSLAMYDGSNTGRMVQWVKRKEWVRHYSEGATTLIAAARCYVTSKLGDTVEVPEELS